MPTLKNKATRVKNKFISWDLALSVVISGAMFWVMPAAVHLKFATDMYMVGITVLSMCIFYFLAFLGLIVSASDEKLMLRLKKEGTFDRVFATYKYTIVVLFVGLLLAILLYAIADYQRHAMPNVKTQTQWYFMAFTFCFIYSILTVFEATLDSVDFLRVRVHLVAERDRFRRKKARQLAEAHRSTTLGPRKKDPSTSDDGKEVGR